MALVISALSIIILGRRGPWSSSVKLFIALFLAVWAGGMWLTPGDPPVWRIYWLPFIATGIVFWVILMAFPEKISPRPKKRRKKGASTKDIKPGPSALLQAYFWILVVCLSIVIFVRYFKAGVAG